MTVMQEQYFTNLAHVLATSPNPVDQRVIDEKRGFWLGAIWVVEKLVQQADREFEAFIAAQTREADRT